MLLSTAAGRRKMASWKYRIQIQLFDLRRRGKGVERVTGKHCAANINPTRNRYAAGIPYFFC